MKCVLVKPKYAARVHSCASVAPEVYIDSHRTWLFGGDSASAVGDARNSKLYLLTNGRAVHVTDYQRGHSDVFAGTCR